MAPGRAHQRPGERGAPVLRHVAISSPLNHRSPFWALGFNASRDATTFTQQVLAVPAGGNVAAVVDAAFATRITDPVQRAAAVDAVSQTAGPSQPASESAERLCAADRARRATDADRRAAWDSETRWWPPSITRKTETISASGEVLPLVSGGGVSNNKQQGGSIVFSHQLTPLTNIVATGTRFTTKALAAAHRHVHDELRAAFGRDPDRSEGGPVCGTQLHRL